jgi:hypothetical protein
MPIPTIFDQTLEELILNHRGDGEARTEPLDGDEVEDLVSVIRDAINEHEGNV